MTDLKKRSMLKLATLSALVAVVGALAVAATVDYTLLLWRERAR